MPPRIIPARARGKGKGKEPVGTSQQLPEIPPNALDLLHPAIATEFEDSFKTRLVMKPHVFDKHDAFHLHLNDVVELLNAQKLGSFLTTKDDYHEDFIRAFYAGLQSGKGYMFKCSIGVRTYTFEVADWETVFQIPLPSHNFKTWHDLKFDTDFNLKEFTLSILKLDRPLGEDEQVTSGMIKKIPRILHWIISHILRPANSGHSRLDRAGIHLLYILQNKVPLNWANYFVKRLFFVRNSAKNVALGYASQIMKILKFWNVAIPLVPLISPSAAQEFDSSTLSHMGYRWDKERQCFYFFERKSKTRIYNFDVPSERIHVVEDQPDEEMHDVNEADVPAADDNAGWGDWVPQRWSPTNYVPEPTVPPFSGGASSSTPTAHLTQMLQQMELANQERHEEARSWHVQQSEWHKEHREWHDDHTRMYHNQHSWHTDLVKWHQVFYNEMSGFMDDCRANPGIMDRFRSVEVQDRFRHYTFMGHNPDAMPPPPPPPSFRDPDRDDEESCGGYNPH